LFLLPGRIGPQAYSLEMTVPLLIGHQKAQEVVRQFPGHTLLLTGPDGVGRRTLARWYAAYLNCSSAEITRPCGSCKSCRTSADVHPDYREIAPEISTSSGRKARKSDIRIRELVVRPGDTALPLSAWLEQRPIYNRRVGVLDGAESLTRGAANAFLKILEEPPSYALIILVASSRSSVFPTVASRCTEIRLGTVDTSEFMDLNFLPAYRLGQIGTLLRARSKPEAAQGFAETISAFINSLSQNLMKGFELAEQLETQWLKADLDIFSGLREHFRSLPAQTYFEAASALDRCEHRLENYAPSSLAFMELMLVLRNIVRNN
jgi:DNA polymerase-3 subunit delta'